MRTDRDGRAGALAPDAAAGHLRGNEMPGFQLLLQRLARKRLIGLVVCALCSVLSVRRPLSAIRVARKPPPPPSDQYFRLQPIFQPCSFAGGRDPISRPPVRIVGVDYWSGRVFLALRCTLCLRWPTYQYVEGRKGGREMDAKKLNRFNFFAYFRRRALDAESTPFLRKSTQHYATLRQIYAIVRYTTSL